MLGTCERHYPGAATPDRRRVASSVVDLGCHRLPPRGRPSLIRRNRRPIRSFRSMATLLPAWRGPCFWRMVTSDLAARANGPSRGTAGENDHEDDRAGLWRCRASWRREGFGVAGLPRRRPGDGRSAGATLGVIRTGCRPQLRGPAIVILGTVVGARGEYIGGFLTAIPPPMPIRSDTAATTANWQPAGYRHWR